MIRTIGELKEKIAGLDDNVKIFALFNGDDPENSEYDQDCDMTIHNLDKGNEDGYVDFMLFRKENY